MVGDAHAKNPLRESDLLLILVSGQDRPGVTAALTAILARYDVDILDIGQRVIHDLLSLGLLVQLPTTALQSPVLKDLLFKAHEMDIGIKFTPVSHAAYEHWVGLQGKPRYILTVLGSRLHARHLSGIATIAAAQGLNIDAMTRLSGRISLNDPEQTPYSCVELSVRGEPADRGALKEALLDFAHAEDCDVAIQLDDIYRRNRRLVAFDMDSTLIQAEVIDELAVEAGVGEQVSAITEAAMRGELDFSESLQQRVAQLRGLDADALQRVAERLPLTEGVERLMATLKHLGYTVAIISGGFTYFGHYLQARLGIDHVYANELEIVDGKVTGRVVGEIVDRGRKAALLRTLAQQEGIALEQAIAVGDGANDLAMLEAAGCGIAFRAKPLVKQQAEHALSSVGLDAILYLLGVHDWHTEEAGITP